MRGQQEGSAVCAMALARAAPAAVGAAIPFCHMTRTTTWRCESSRLCSGYIIGKSTFLGRKHKNFNLFFTLSCLLCCPWPAGSVSQQTVVWHTPHGSTRNRGKADVQWKKCTVIKIVHFFLDTENDPLRNTACSEAKAFRLVLLWLLPEHCVIWQRIKAVVPTHHFHSLGGEHSIL